MQIRLFSHIGACVATSQDQAHAVAGMLLQNRSEWLQRLVENPDSFRDVERDVDQQFRTGGGQFVAALLQEASQTAALPVEKNVPCCQGDYDWPVADGESRCIWPVNGHYEILHSTGGEKLIR